VRKNQFFLFDIMFFFALKYVINDYIVHDSFFFILANNYVGRWRIFYPHRWYLAIFYLVGISKIVFQILFCVASTKIKPSNESESSQFNDT